MQSSDKTIVQKVDALRHRFNIPAGVKIVRLGAIGEDPTAKLRTLLIVVALLAVGLARISNLKHQRDFHRQEVQKLLPELAGLDGNIDDTAEQVIVLTALREWKVAANWHRARKHEIMAQQYNYAIYRPWTVVGDANIPNGRPD